jgi:hypothetical protein
MPRRQPIVRRWLTAASWPLGIAMTSWDYMWRSTPLHRSEADVAAPAVGLALLEFPDGVSDAEVLGEADGHGPLFHRRYRTRIRDAEMGAETLMSDLRRNLNQAAPTGFARFHKLLGSKEALECGDEYVVRMPGPWDGPVRVIDVRPRSFRLATLDGHLEAGQIEFRAIDGDGNGDGGRLAFEIESWARSSGWFADLLYHRLRMAKEIQAHMWISFLEGVVELSGGRMTGGVTIETERIEDPDDEH